MSGVSFRHRLRVLSRHVTLSLCFGMSLIVLVWTVTVTRIRVESDEALFAAARSTENLSRVFEENVTRTISDIDKSLMLLVSLIQRAGTTADAQELLSQAFVRSEGMLQLSLVNEQGVVIASSHGVPVPAVSILDREHFRVHQSGRVDGLFISKPVLGRVTGKWSTQFTRRLSAPDGSFAGVVVASVDPYFVSRFYNSINLGKAGTIALVGSDGVIRAGGIRQPIAPGLDVSAEPFFREMSKGIQGTLIVGRAADGEPDRVLSFRRIHGLPLFVTVAIERPELSLRPSGNLSIHIVGSFVLTLVVLATMVISIRHNNRLEAARLSLVASEGELRVRSRELQLTLDNITQGIMMVAPDDEVAVVNQRAVELLEIPADLLASTFTYRQLVKVFDERGEYRDQTKISPEALAYVRGEAGSMLPIFERERPNGTVLEIRTNPLPDGGFVRTFTDITERRRSEARIIHLARHDSLTNLANRVVFRQELENAIAARRTGFAVLGIDLDRFKVVNDTAGHPVGDRLLKMVAKRLQLAVREGDLPARLGGDEFAVIQMDVRDAATAGALAARICRRLAEPYEIEGKNVFIGASIGIAMADGSPADAMLKAADLALYAAKSEGRGTYRFFDPEMNARFDERRQLEDSLRNALAAEELDVHYQPKIDVASRRICGFEALLRWHHPVRGHVSPSDFIPIAEELGLIVPIGAWVLERACRDVTQLPGGEGIAVNLSTAQFRSGDLVEIVERALQSSGLEPHRLELEITETLLLERDEKTLEQLYALRRIGVRVSMDDFGTGYSSLSYLLSFPFDRIKIDRSFVKQLGQRGPSHAIVRAIVGLARSLGIATTAEGVEDAAELDVLSELGCTEAQGYAFGRPEPAHLAFAQLLKPIAGPTEGAGRAAGEQAA